MGERTVPPIVPRWRSILAVLTVSITAPPNCHLTTTILLSRPLVTMSSPTPLCGSILKSKPVVKKLADCEPYEGDDDTCNTGDEQYTFTNTDGTTMYVLVCMECHYWFGDCDIDAFEACLNGPYKQGMVSCPDCK